MLKNSIFNFLNAIRYSRKYMKSTLDRVEYSIFVPKTLYCIGLSIVKLMCDRETDTA